MPKSFEYKEKRLPPLSLPDDPVLTRGKAKQDRSPCPRHGFRSISLPCPPKSAFSQPSQLHKFPPPPPFLNLPRTSFTSHVRRQKEPNSTPVPSHQKLQTQELEHIDSEEEDALHLKWRPRGRRLKRDIINVKNSTMNRPERRSQSRNKLVERSHITPPPFSRWHSRSPSIPAVSPLSPPLTSSASNLMTLKSFSTTHKTKPSTTSNLSRLSSPLPIYPASGYYAPRSMSVGHRRYESQYYYPRSPSRSHSRPPSPRPRPTVGHSPKSSLPRSFSSPSLMSSFSRFSSMSYYSNLLSRTQRTVTSPISPTGSTFNNMALSSGSSVSRAARETQRHIILPTQPIVAPVTQDGGRKKRI